MITTIELARKGLSEQIGRFFQNGALSPNEISSDGLQETALHIAARNSDIVLINILQEYAANPFSENYKKKKAIDIAIDCKNAEVTEMLINYMDDYLSYYTRTMRGIRSHARTVIPNYRKIPVNSLG